VRFTSNSAQAVVSKQQQLLLAIACTPAYMLAESVSRMAQHTLSLVVSIPGSAPCMHEAMWVSCYPGYTETCGWSDTMHAFTPAWLLAAAGAQQVCCRSNASDGAAGGDACQAAGSAAPWACAGAGAARHTVSPSCQLLPARVWT
jgi:hypothetical protein